MRILLVLVLLFAGCNSSPTVAAHVKYQVPFHTIEVTVYYQEAKQ